MKRNHEATDRKHRQILKKYMVDRGMNIPEFCKWMKLYYIKMEKGNENAESITQKAIYDWFKGGTMTFRKWDIIENFIKNNQHGKKSKKKKTD